MIRVDVERFEALVEAALEGLPPALADAMDNVAVIVDDETPPGDLLGLYEGIPLTERDDGYSFVMPDRITIFQQTICASCDSEDDVVDMVRETVVHEIAHHFGIDDDRLDELGRS
ncbi:MAG TPA: metallopeptidase family protein [Acidimicrobiales bacterium]|nr:metallopeptidase family protein [Acidimicrobiales bacterium]